MHLGVTFRTAQDGSIKFFMVTERCSDLKTLEEYLNDLKKPTGDQYKNSLKNYEDLYKIIKQIVSMIKYLHKKNMGHGQLCPQNILVDKHSVRLCDFKNSFMESNLHQS